MGRLLQFRHRGDDVSGEAIVDGFAAGGPEIPLRIFSIFLMGWPIASAKSLLSRSVEDMAKAIVPEFTSAAFT